MSAISKIFKEVAKRKAEVDYAVYLCKQLGVAPEPYWDDGWLMLRVPTGIKRTGQEN